MGKKREITRDDILPMDTYARERKQRRRDLLETKKKRRMDVGPVCTFYFENYETMWAQVHEMLFIEQGGEAQIPDELAAYNPLIPRGNELVATVMFEIDDEVRRSAFLAKLGGIEETAFLQFSGENIHAVSEEDIDRTTAEGKASSVQFIHFPFTADQIARFKQPSVQVTVGFKHPNYSHMAIMPEAMRAALCEDFD
jgi:hypothetical protein